MKLYLFLIELKSNTQAFTALKIHTDTTKESPTLVNHSHAMAAEYSFSLFYQKKLIEIEIIGLKFNQM